MVKNWCSTFFFLRYGLEKGKDFINMVSSHNVWKKKYNIIYKAVYLKNK